MCKSLFSNKATALSLQLSNSRTLTQVFSYDFSEIFKKICFYKSPPILYFCRAPSSNAGSNSIGKSDQINQNKSMQFNLFTKILHRQSCLLGIYQSQNRILRQNFQTYESTIEFSKGKKEIVVVCSFDSASVQYVYIFSGF